PPGDVGVPARQCMVGPLGDVRANAAHPRLLRLPRTRSKLLSPCKVAARSLYFLASVMMDGPKVTQRKCQSRRLSAGDPLLKPQRHTALGLIQCHSGSGRRMFPTCCSVGAYAEQIRFRRFVSLPPRPRLPPSPSTPRPSTITVIRFDDMIR